MMLTEPAGKMFCQGWSRLSGLASRAAAQPPFFWAHPDVVADCCAHGGGILVAPIRHLLQVCFAVENYEAASVGSQKEKIGGEVRIPSSASMPKPPPFMLRCRSPFPSSLSFRYVGSPPIRNRRASLFAAISVAFFRLLPRQGLTSGHTAHPFGLVLFTPGHTLSYVSPMSRRLPQPLLSDRRRNHLAHLMGWWESMWGI
ncbi:hypothetical protein QBC34DRAFT_389714 [Podospora aff. communis PSN243]|uniref:Uncharacterized protein n=1 Tax=Podospora aff. communis PSN243 TaxID=3040156 RepID=A0AAV9H4D2_9PEZI|nr:hypothetical protein QBC34DRAFT_389714 [Podospora aff. communis PSN243]